MLPVTLGSVYALRPDEVFFCADRCTDGTEDLMRRWGDAHSKVTETTIRRYTDADGVGWRFRGGYLRRDAYARARNDIIVNSAADIRLCPSIARLVEEIPDPYALISFHYYEKPWTIQCFERALINSIRNQGFAGLLSVSREAWLAAEDIEDLKRIERGEDTHLKMALLKKKYPTVHAHTYSLHLRPNETWLDHYYRGQATYVQVYQNPVKAFIQSAMMFRPAMFTGFMHARTLDRRRRGLDYM